MAEKGVVEDLQSLDDADEKSLPPVPGQSTHSLSLPTPVNRDSSVTGTSQSMRTSSFAMSDISESKLPQLESLRIRRAYTRPSQSRKSNIDSIAESETADYPDEIDFQKTDRYVRFLGQIDKKVRIPYGSDIQWRSSRSEESRYIEISSWDEK
jgi:hypothetical protein